MQIVSRIVLSLLMFTLSFTAIAQTPTPVIPPVPTINIPTVDPSTLPASFMAAGAGFSKGGQPIGASGWFDYCKKSIMVGSFGTELCAATDFSGSGVNTGRVDLDLVMYHVGSCFFGTKTGAGVASGATGGIGFTAALGVWGACRINKAKNLFIVSSGSWDPTTAQTVTTNGAGISALANFGSQTVFRIGFGL